MSTVKAILVDNTNANTGCEGELATLLEKKNQPTIMVMELGWKLLRMLLFPILNNQPKNCYTLENYELFSAWIRTIFAIILHKINGLL